MRYIIGSILFFLFIPICSASENMAAECGHNKIEGFSDLLFFNKMDSIKLGECVGGKTIKKKSIVNLPSACDEVIEDKLNPLGIMSLTQLEAIQIGLCRGVINYINQHYHNEAVPKHLTNYNYNKKYFCRDGFDAVNIIRKSSSDKHNRSDVRDLLCVVR